VESAGLHALSPIFLNPRVAGFFLTTIHTGWLPGPKHIQTRCSQDENQNRHHFFDTGLTANEGATTTSFAPLPYHPSVLPPFSGPSSRPVSNCLLNRIFGRRGWTLPGSWRSARLAPWTSLCPSEPRTVVRSLRSVACRASSPLLPRALASNRKLLSPSFHMLKRDVSFPSLPTSYGLRVRDGARTTVRTESPRRTDRSSDLAAAVERAFGNVPRKGLDCG
jgi:hypothetical protein